MAKNKYICSGCETVYHTTEDKAPPTPRWSDGHECTLVKIMEDKVIIISDPGDEQIDSHIYASANN
jgi:hypothetical protein